MFRTRSIVKAICALAAVVSLGALASSCDKDGGKELDNTSVLIYLAANNSLSINADDCIRQLAKGYLPERGTNDCEVLVYSHTIWDRPVLFKLTRGADGTKTDSTVLRIYDSLTVSSTAEMLHQVILDAEAVAPAKHHGLVLWSHASGYLPEGYLNNPVESAKPDRVRKTFGQDYHVKDEIELKDLAEALPFHYDYIIFDCCLMGGVEVAYELKDKCDYISFSPAEIMSQGYPYYMMMDPLFHNTNKEEAVKAICQEYYHYYDSMYQRYLEQPLYRTREGGTVSLVRTARLDALASACRTIFNNHRTEIFSLGFYDVQGYYRLDCHWFFDLRDMVSKVATASEMAAFDAALEAVVPYAATTPGLLTLDIDPNKYSGLSTYLPRSGFVYLNNYYKTLAWNKATGLVE